MNIITPQKTDVANAFSAKAYRYDNNTPVQKGILEKLSIFLSKRSSIDQIWLDAGCGTGLFEQILLENANLPAQIVCIDIAPGALTILGNRNIPQTKLIRADIDFLPCKQSSFDGAIASSVLQWLPDPWESIDRITRLIKPSGLFAFSFFCTGSFNEFYTVRTNHGLSIPIHLFDNTQIVSRLHSLGLKVITQDFVDTTHYFPTGMQALKSIASIGSSATGEKSLSRSLVTEISNEYETLFLSDRGVGVTYKICLGIAQIL